MGAGESSASDRPSTGSQPAGLALRTGLRWKRAWISPQLSISSSPSETSSSVYSAIALRDGRDVPVGVAFSQAAEVAPGPSPQVLAGRHREQSQAKKPLSLARRDRCFRAFDPEELSQSLGDIGDPLAGPRVAMLGVSARHGCAHWRAEQRLIPATLNVNGEGMPLKRADGVETGGSPLRHDPVCFGLCFDLGPFHVQLPPFLAAHRAIEQDHEPAHDLVIAGGLGQLEDPFDERLVAERVERAKKIIEQKPPRGGRLSAYHFGAKPARVSASENDRSSSTNAGSPRSSFLENEPITRARIFRHPARPPACPPEAMAPGRARACRRDHAQRLPPPPVTVPLSVPAPKTSARSHDRRSSSSPVARMSVPPSPENATFLR